MTDLRKIDFTKEDFQFILKTLKTYSSAVKLADSTNFVIERMALNSFPEGEIKQTALKNLEEEKRIKEEESQIIEMNSVIISAKVISLLKHFEEEYLLG